MSLMASLLMAGCSQEEIPDGGKDSNGDGNSYMTINLVSSDAVGSRASSGYEDGEESESKVTNVRFYFFNGTGGAALVKLKNGQYVNYYDWTPEEQKSDKDDDDIESILSATIIINTTQEDKLPTMVAAVLNPTITDNQSRSLSDLKSHVADYATTELTTSGKFVMYNAVYAKGNTEISATPIQAGNLQDTEEKAKANPVTIYVERNVAKVSVELAAGFDATTKRLELTSIDKTTQAESPLTIDGKQVYLEILGWDLTAETSEGRLIKKINPQWGTEWVWNSTHRSFWAINSMTDNIHNVYLHNYNNISTSFDKALYTNENAQKTDIDASIQCKAQKNTKVILKGKLCDENGKALNIVRHIGAHFIDDNNYSQLRRNILSQLAINKQYYYDDVDGTGTVIGRKQIGIDEIQIANTTLKPVEDSENNCYVYAQLTEAAKTKTWYTSMAEDALPIADAAKTINADLANPKLVSWPLVWKSGMTYYYYEIKHLPESKETGVVRNHIYKTKVTKIAGLGTPVYNPEDIIYPEKPDDNDHYIAAEVDILSWRIVNNEYELKW